MNRVFESKIPLPPNDLIKIKDRCGLIWFRKDGESDKWYAQSIAD